MGAAGSVERVGLLGHDGELAFEETAEGLAVTLPEVRPCEHASTLRIQGLRLRGSDPAPPR